MSISKTAPKVLLSADKIQNRLAELGEELNSHYKALVTESQPLVVICVLKGAFMFCSDLVKHLDFPCQIEFVRLSSYGDARTTSGAVTPVDPLNLVLPDLTGRHVLVVEDIVDTGLTAHFFMSHLKDSHNVKSMALAALLDKKAKRKQIVRIDYCAFDIEDVFVIGYGLDDSGLCRNLPYVGIVE